MIVMGIQYFYNFCIKENDDTDLQSDILSAVRKSYFSDFEKIRDKITYDSEGASMLYDYCIEQSKPMRWTVKLLDGATVQEVMPADNGRYYLCYYRGEALFKRLLFSKLHTLLKAEYMDRKGAVYRTIEPRKIQGGLCLLYTDSQLQKPLVLSAMPSVYERPVSEKVSAEFTDYTAIASTNEGIIPFLSDEQMVHFRQFVDESRSEIAEKIDESFVKDGTPLYEKINAKDFNIKRNLSASLDITDAKPFTDSAAAEKNEPIIDTLKTEDNAQTAEPVEPVIEQDDIPTEPIAAEAPFDDAPTEDSSAENGSAEEKDEEHAMKPDKQIMADGAIYSYYGELDNNGNRSGYGRTLTDIGKIAYEGEYLNDKRTGKGAYFYKDGTLCYSGDWSENVRHGVGVGVSAHDGSMHIGKWVNNKPEGNGVRVTAEGEIKFVCKELSDGCTALMNYLDNDTVMISKYDKNGTKVSEKTISLAE